LKPNPPASKVALLRRAYYDLIGLPPSPEEVRAFVERRRHVGTADDGQNGVQQQQTGDGSDVDRECFGTILFTFRRLHELACRDDYLSDDIDANRERCAQ